MKFIEKIRAKPRAAKLRIIWTVVIVFAILLIVVWVISSRYNKRVNKDMSLFQTIGQGFHNVKASFKK